MYFTSIKLRDIVSTIFHIREYADMPRGLQRSVLGLARLNTETSSLET